MDYGSIGDYSMKQKFKKGQLVRHKYTGRIFKIRNIIFAGHYYCYYVEGIEGYFIDTDFERA